MLCVTRPRRSTAKPDLNRVTHSMEARQSILEPIHISSRFGDFSADRRLFRRPYGGIDTSEFGGEIR